MCKSSGRDTPQSGGRCGSRLWLFAPQSLGTCAPPSVDASATCSGSRSWRWHFPAMRPRPPVSPTQRPAKPSLSRRRGLSGCTSKLSHASRHRGSAGMSGSPTAPIPFASPPRAAQPWCRAVKSVFRTPDAGGSTCGSPIPTPTLVASRVRARAVG